MTRAQLREALFQTILRSVYRKTNQLFFWLLIAQWVFAIGLALVLSPYSWVGRTHSLHPHVAAAVFLGGLMNALPLVLIRQRPDWWLTRHSVAVMQMLWSALLIHLTGGRIETHFHIFGSLAFIAFYRDWKLMPTATLVVVIDHLARGLFWPESVYGIANPEWWRFVEHAGWVAFEDVVLLLSCARAVAEMRLVADREAALELSHGEIEQQVHERTAELQQNMHRYRSLVENTNAIPWEFDPASARLVYVAPQAARLLGCAESALANAGFFTPFIQASDRQRVQDRIARLAAADSQSDSGDHFDFRAVRSDGSAVDCRTIVSPRQPGQPLRGVTIDITKQRKLESELLQAQKLESVGRLAAGVAHEINTPVQFVSDSVHFLRDAAMDLVSVVQKLQLVRRSVAEGTPSLEAAVEAQRAEESADLPYLLEHLTPAFDRSIDGLARVATIVRSMKEFAHPDSAQMTTIDLNRAIESTLTIARNEYKYVADLETEFGNIPPVRCHPGGINQAVLNIVVNAAHAIGDIVAGTSDRGRIAVSTRLDGEWVVITISDTGGGIPEDIEPQIFDPFFTTKQVGKGTGQGLSIARSVVVDQHQGELTLKSELGRGTSFFIRLPADPGQPAAQTSAPS